MRALWIGGPPGKTMNNIIKNLGKKGIEIVDRWDSVVDTMRHKHRIPTGIELVLVNHEMCSHIVHDHVKAMCKRDGKRFVLASMNTSKTMVELAEKKVVISPAPMVVVSDLDLVCSLVDERALLLVQKRGIEERLRLIEERLDVIRKGLNV